MFLHEQILLSNNLLKESKLVSFHKVHSNLHPMLIYFNVTCKLHMLLCDPLY